MQKKSEFSELSDKVDICEDPREARLEINSGRYDSYFGKVMKIYFSSEYNNTNELKIEKSEIRKKFLEDFDFRKAIIEFSQKKGLGKENPQVRNTFKQRMNFEGEGMEEIKKGYSKQIKSLFFNQKKIDSKKETIEDPILNILSQEDKKKVILSKKYGGNIKTFSKLIAILELVDNTEQEDVLKYLLDDNFKKGLLFKELGSNHSNLSLENIFKIIDIIAENSYNNLLKISLEGKSLYDDDIRKYGSRSNTNTDSFTTSIILYTIKKHLGSHVSIEGYEFILGKLSYQKMSLNKESAGIVDKFIEQFINGLEIIDGNTDKKIFNLLIRCFEYIDRKQSININNDKINFDIIKDVYNEKYREIGDPYYVLNGIEYCKKSQKKTI